MNLRSDIAERRALARKTDDPNYRVRREELIHAAARVFRQKGFGAAKLDDIAKEIGKDRASLYYYTSGKDELFQDVVAEAVMSNVNIVEELYQQDVTSVAKLRCLIVRLMESFEKHYPYLFVYVQEPMAHLDDSTEWNRMMRALQHRFDDGVRGIIRQGIKDGTLRVAESEVKVVANGIIGMASWSHRWFQPDKEHSGADVGAIFADLIIGGIASDLTEARA